MRFSSPETSTVSPGKFALRSISEAQRAAPTVDVKVKRIEASGTRFITIDIVPKLAQSKCQIAPWEGDAEDSRNVSTLSRCDKFIALAFSEAFQVEEASMVGGPCLAPLKYEEDGSADNRYKVEWEEYEVFDDRSRRESERDLH